MCFGQSGDVSLASGTRLRAPQPGVVRVSQVKHTRDVMPAANPEILVMCVGVTSGVSRLVCGKVADIPGVNRVQMQQAAFFFIGIATACIPFARDFSTLVVIVLLMGVCDGCFICLMGPIAVELLGPTGAAQGLGCLFGLMSVPMTIGPPLAGQSAPSHSSERRTKIALNISISPKSDFKNIGRLHKVRAIRSSRLVLQPTLTL